MTRRFAVLAGLPRSGSTLLCNLLAQRDDVTVSSTSALPAILGQVSTLLTNSPEVTSDLVNVAGARERNVAVLRAIIDAWHPEDGRLMIDKSRGWGWTHLLLLRVVPDARVIATVRHPCDVFESIERQHRASAEYGPHEAMYDTASNMFSREGLIGGPIAAVEDMLRRNPQTATGGPAIQALMYETLAISPQTAMRAIEQHLGLDSWEYDFDKVVSVATDEDALYRFKYPHDGSGKVEMRAGQGLVPPDLADMIRERWPFFHRAFGYS